MAVGALPDGTPVIVSGGHDGTVRMWRLADGTPHGKPLTGHTDWVNAVAVGALPGGTPVIVSGSRDTVRVWRLADGAPHGKPLTGHDGLGSPYHPAQKQRLASRPGNGRLDCRVWLREGVRTRY